MTEIYCWHPNNLFQKKKKIKKKLCCKLGGWEAKRNIDRADVYTVSPSQSKSQLQLLLLIPAMSVQPVLMAIAPNLPSCQRYECVSNKCFPELRKPSFCRTEHCIPRLTGYSLTKPCLVGKPDRAKRLGRIASVLWTLLRRVREEASLNSKQVSRPGFLPLYLVFCGKEGTSFLGLLLTLQGGEGQCWVLAKWQRLFPLCISREKSIEDVKGLVHGR